MLYSKLTRCASAFEAIMCMGRLSVRNAHRIDIHFQSLNNPLMKYLPSFMGSIQISSGIQSNHGKRGRKREREIRHNSFERDKYA